MTSSPTPFLFELEAGHIGPEIPASKRAYFQQRLRNKVFNFLIDKFVTAQRGGLTKASLARRIGKTPDLINRWLGAPSNLTIDSVSDLLLGIAAEELELTSSSPLGCAPANYSHFHELAKASALNERFELTENIQDSRRRSASAAALIGTGQQRPSVSALSGL